MDLKFLKYVLLLVPGARVENRDFVFFFKMSTSDERAYIERPASVERN